MQRKCWNCLHVFVGDSIGNQWESLLCILSSAVLDKDSIYEVNGNPIAKHTRFLVFELQDFNCTTLEYYRAPFLVLQSQKPAGAPEKVKATVKLVKMDWSSNQWKGADVTVLTLAVDGIMRRLAEIVSPFYKLRQYRLDEHEEISGYANFRIVTSKKGEEVKKDMSVESVDQMPLEMAIDWIISKFNLNKTRKSSLQYISGGILAVVTPTDYPILVLRWFYVKHGTHFKIFVYAILKQVERNT